MLPELASLVDAFHALLMLAWVLGLPLLFWHRWPTFTRWYSRFAIAFIVLNQLSHFLIGECFLTTLSRAIWRLDAPDPHQVPSEWFTVRFAKAVFNLTPSHALIKRLTQVMIAITAAGMLWSMRAQRRRAKSASAEGAPDESASGDESGSAGTAKSRADERA